MIPLILHKFSFSFHPIEASYIIFEYFYLSLSFFFLSLIFPFNTHVFFFFFSLKYGCYEKLKLIHPPLIPFHQYQLKHYRDRKLKEKEMDPTKLTEPLKHLTSIDIQWVVEWWRIEAMTSCGFKENCLSLVGLRRCFYFPTCRIAQQFGDR